MREPKSQRYCRCGAKVFGAWARKCMDCQTRERSERERQRTKRRALERQANRERALPCE